MNTQEQIEECTEFIQTQYKGEVHKLAGTGANTLLIDFNHILNFKPELTDQLLDDPEETIKAMEIAVDSLDLGEFKVRFFNLPKSQFVMIRDIRSSHLGKLIYIEGIVRQSSDVRPQVISAKFECPSCGNNITILQLDSKFKEPSRCTCGRKGQFRLIHKDLVDAQRLVMEEVPESLEGGAQPKRLSVFLKEDLVEPKMEKKSTPGSKIRIIGIIKEIPITLRTGGQSTRYDLAMDSNLVEPIEETFADLKLAEEDVAKIKKLSKNPRIFNKLVKSIAPSIYGHEKVKEAILLQLFGGVRKEKPDGTSWRGDSHILLVGDPGSGKSQILQFISKAAPKARFVAGKGVSAAGLTSSVVKDEFMKGWALEAGALVLANGGICVIDELDKIGREDLGAMHSAMEQQIIPISKANIQATLLSQTTILAAANPKLGRFDPYAPIASQIELESTLINRFDLIFPIRDIPDRDKDSKIASHVLKTHKNPENIKSEIDPDLLKKYISYAKQEIFPQLTQEAIDEIHNFYVELRNKGQSGDDEIKPIPISARQLEALVRLSEASARIKLSKTVTKEDAQRAIELLKHCLMQVGFDYETGQIDIDRITTGISTSERSRIITIREIINTLDQRLGKQIPLQDVLSEAEEKKIGESQVEEAIDKLKREGYIFEPKRGILSKL